VSPLERRVMGTCVDCGRPSPLFNDECDATCEVCDRVVCDDCFVVGSRPGEDFVTPHHVVMCIGCSHSRVSRAP